VDGMFNIAYASQMEFLYSCESKETTREKRTENFMFFFIKGEALRRQYKLLFVYAFHLSAIFFNHHGVA
jgi:hypothetical protein